MENLIEESNIPCEAEAQSLFLFKKNENILVCDKGNLKEKDL